jgi:hypothetical protein
MKKIKLNITLISMYSCGSFIGCGKDDEGVNQTIKVNA